MGFREWLANFRAERAAKMAEQAIRVKADAERRLAEQRAQSIALEQDRLAQAAERLRVAELSARGGAQVQDLSEFDVIYDEVASVRAGSARFRTKTRGLITAEQRPKIDWEATAAARALNPNAHAVFYWP